jgi:hypothetical protein
MKSNILFIIYYSVVFYAFFILSGDGYSSGLNKTVMVGWKGSLKIGDVFRESGHWTTKKSSGPFLTNCHYTEKLSLSIPPPPD